MKKILLHALAFMMAAYIFISCKTAKELEQKQSGDYWLLDNALASEMAHDFQKGVFDNRRKTHSIIISKADFKSAIDQVDGDTVYLSFATYTRYRIVDTKKNRPTLILKLKSDDKKSNYLDLGTYKAIKTSSLNQTSAVKKYLSGNLCPPPNICDRCLESN